MKRFLAFFTCTAVFFLAGFIGADFFTVEYTKYEGTQNIYKEIDTQKNSQELEGTSEGEPAGQTEEGAEAQVLQESQGQADVFVPYRLLANTPNNLEQYRKLSVVSAQATSTIVQENVDNSPLLLFDGRDDTDWQEGVTGYGIGESVTASFGTEHQVKYVALKLGNWKSDEYYYGNAKPKALTIMLGDFEEQVAFPDEKAVQWVELSDEASAESMKLTIDEIYEGTEWEDTCITEVTIYGK